MTSFALPRRRVILLGASNVARALPTIVATLRRNWAEPIEIMAAMGHGRSYWRDSTVLGRKIPGIFPCALWQDLQTRPHLPTHALMTDIGNDFLYGATPRRVLEYLERCLDRLVEVKAETVISLLPAESIEHLGQTRYQFFRRLFFPSSTLSLAEAKACVREMNARLHILGNQRKIPIIPVSSTWYGLDPIHIRRHCEGSAWSAMLSARQTEPPADNYPRVSLSAIAYCASLAPLEWSQFGIPRRATQPNGRLHDGTTISLY